MYIEFYQELGEYNYLSNYSNYGFYINNIFYKTVEHYYQSEKYLDNEIKQKIINASTPKEASMLGKEQENKIRKDFKLIKNDVMYKGIYEKFIQNKSIMYKLIETRNKTIVEKNVEEYYWGTSKDEPSDNNIGKILMKVRTDIKNQILNTILKECNKKVYVLGHANPDADSIFSSYILTQILKSKKINAEFCILNKDYNFSNKDKELIEAFLPEKPTIITNTKDKKYILVDTNSKNALVNVIGAFDHHKITGEIDHVLEMEYSSTGLLIYDIFKDQYNFNEEERNLIALTVITDTDYLCSKRFTKEDEYIYNKLNTNLNVSELRKKYFKVTDFSKSIESNLKADYKEYNINNKKIKRSILSSYNTDYKKYFNQYVKYLEKIDNYLMIWCNYESKKTIIYYNKKIVKVDYILTSTFIIINDILCNEHELLTQKTKTLYK